MFDLSKYAINDILKDYAGKKPIVMTSTIDNVHPDYIVTTTTTIIVKKKQKDKKVSKKGSGFAKQGGK